MTDELDALVGDARGALDQLREGVPRRGFGDVLARTRSAAPDAGDEDVLAWAIDARQALERRIEMRPRGKGFADVVQRAAALAPDAVHAEAVHNAEALAPVVDLTRAARAQRELDGLVKEVQHEVEGLVSARVAGGVRDETQVPEPTQRRRRAVVIAAVAVAAGLVAAIGLVTPSLIDRDVADVRGDQAMRSGESMGSQRDALVRDEEPTRVVPAPRPRKPVPPRVPQAAPVIEEAPVVDLPQPAPAASAVERPKAKTTAPKPSKQERVATLMDDAERAWRAGALDEAEGLYEQVTRIGGKRSAEQAYADLFSLARQRGDHKGEASRWRAYLKRFPRGRFADDARAGLCRRASGEAARTCWGRYLENHPKGSFRAEAERATVEQ